MEFRDSRIENNEDIIEDKYEFKMYKSHEFTRECIDPELVNKLAKKWNYDIEKTSEKENKRFDERLFNFNNREATKDNITNRFPTLTRIIERILNGLFELLRNGPY